MEIFFTVKTKKLYNIAVAVQSFTSIVDAKLAATKYIIYTGHGIHNFRPQNNISGT
jgi:uroporphyrinogen-III decarboxylase